MAKFDLAKTAMIQQLCDVPTEGRDGAWRRRLYDAVPEASMRSAAPQVIAGPDGFPYFVLSLPLPGTKFETFCLTHILDVCLERGFGIVLNPEKGRPDFVFPYGVLWAFKDRGDFEPPLPRGASAGATKEIVKEEREVLMAQPSEAFLPRTARRVIAKFMNEALGIARPSCFMMMDSAAVPVQNLVFNFTPSDFDSPEGFQNAMHLMRWFLPPDYGTIAIGGYEEHYQPL